MKVNDNKQILIVDDEQIDRQMMTIFLGGEYKLSFADNYDAACALILRQAFDLIITDLHMSFKEDGSQVLAFARASELNQHVPVIAYTASRSGLNKQSLIESGFDGHLTKPVLKNDIQNFIRSILK
jgi:CheY-like chemotaxis protein